MNFFKKNEQKSGLINQTSKTEEIMEKREDIKLELATKLHNAGFPDDEVEYIIQIIRTAESDIQKIKDGLIGTNINPQGDPMEPLIKGKEAIRARQLQMQKDIQLAIEEFKKHH